ncbi:peroxisomal N(1)-acetyl-spermine/spermidine oxidase-like [Diabrotica undecimpunctata]|uniref:peroxisomal N(1)-acetyl-spermine/spermidine oxidase-like n=1 Tax=Diabrotica undecimpunctata TaxID=50387 RepID=UPI003B63922C
MHPLTVLPILSRFVLRHNRKTLRIVCKRRYSKAEECKKPPPEVRVCTISECMVDPCKPEPSVIIIGAGIAGLSAAQRLLQCGISNFKILEATERPGGRIHSCMLSNIVTEMGCHYIKGACVANPVFNLAAQEGLLKPPLNTDNPLKGLYCTSDGRAIDYPVSTMAFHIFKCIEKEAFTLFNMGCRQDHGSLKKFVYLRIQQEIQKFPEDQRYDISRILYGLTNSLRYKIGDDLDNVSADNVGSLIKIPGGNVTVPDGFVSVLSPLLRDLPKCSIEFNKPVGLIRWGAVQGRGQASRAIVQCCDSEEFCADYVIITVSLGVLKEHGDKLFCPALPTCKLEAIKCLGYGSVDKIFLDYERPFWIWSNGSIKLAWSQKELADRTDWTKGISAIEEVEGSKHVLCAYVSGPEAVVMEHATDEEVAEGITKLLRQFTGDPSLPYPSTILRSKWSSDPYFCGAYSYMNLKSNIGHQCDLSSPVPGSCEPVPPILLFAGEATCAGHHSTVHGARLSGIREAERIIQLTKQYGGPPPYERQ